MIGKLEVQVQAHSPNFPLCPCFTFKGSPSSLRIMGVPKQVGSWRITEVYATLHYPDDVERTKLAVREGNVWVATIDGCETTGKVANGLTIAANGIDEDGNAVTGYVLGRGDIYVMDGDAIVPDPSTTKNYMKLCDTLPQTPSKGDAFFQNGVLVVWDGTNWVPSADVLSKRGIDDFNVYSRPDQDTEIYVGIEKCVWNETSQRWENEQGATTIEPPQSPQSNTYVVNVQSVQDEVELAPPYYNGTYHGDYTDLVVRCNQSYRIAKTSDLPTKTSDLVNDSGFITSSAIPSSYSSISDDDNNVIFASRAVRYMGDGDPYWVVTWDTVNYTLSGGDKYYASYFPSEPSPGDFGFSLTFYDYGGGYGEWYLEVQQWYDDGEYGWWDYCDGRYATEASQDATELHYEIWEEDEPQYVQFAEWTVPQVQVSGELALKGYVDAQLTTLSSAMSSAISSGVSEAKSYADSKDATVLSSAQTYANTQCATTLNSAKSYTNTKLANTVSFSGTYADTTTFQYTVYTT